MGCDIHVMTEKKRTWSDGTIQWVNIDNWQFNEYYDKYNDEGEREFNVKSIFRDRNYELFAFLAGVRNYGGNECFGFDRGFPEDACRITKKEYDSWDSDAHTPGYCTLKELKEAVKGVQKIRREGAVTKEQADRYRETGETPDSWAQGIGFYFGIAPEYQDRFEWMVWEDEVSCFDRLLQAIEQRKVDEFYWGHADRDDGSEDDNIRIVFWFDN